MNSKETPGAHRRRKRKIPPQRIDKLSNRFLSNLKNVDINPNIVLVGKWEEIVGPELKGHIQLGKLDAKGVLHLIAEDPNWATKARWQTGEIEKRAAKFLDFGKISKIQISVITP